MAEIGTAVDFVKAVSTSNVLSSEYAEDAIIFMQDTHEIWLDGQCYSGAGVKEIAYADLKKLRDTGKLSPGKIYRLIDYKCTTTQEDTSADNHIFDILILATDNKTLNENCRAALHKDDTYFLATDSLDRWQIWYSIDNDQKRFLWADPENGKGVIYRMIDDHGNDLPYDFKNIKFKRYKVTCTNISHDLHNQYVGIKNVDMDGQTNTSESKEFYTFQNTDSKSSVQDLSVYKAETQKMAQGSGSSCADNKMKPAYTQITVDNAGYQTVHSLNNIVFNTLVNEQAIVYSNTFEGDCSNNTFIGQTYNNQFGNSLQKNQFGNWVYNNQFGNNVYRNQFGNYCYYNTFGNGVNNNTFGNEVRYNTFGNWVYNNQFGNGVYENQFGNRVYENQFGNEVRYNTFGNDVGYNTFGNYIQYCIFENNIQFCKLDSYPTSDTNYLQNIKVLSGTKGGYNSATTLLSLDQFKLGANYQQCAGFKSTVPNITDTTTNEILQNYLFYWTPVDVASATYLQLYEP